MSRVSVNKLGCRLNILCRLLKNLNSGDFVVVIPAECCEQKCFQIFIDLVASPREG